MDYALNPSWNPPDFELHGFRCRRSCFRSEIAPKCRACGPLSETQAELEMVCSPPARWGLLDFMSVDFRLPPPSAAFRRLPPPSASSGPQPRPSTPSVPCRTSTARIHSKCSLPDLNRDHPRPVFPAGPQPRPSTPSVPCRTSTAGENAKRYAR